MPARNAPNGPCSARPQAWSSPANGPGGRSWPDIGSRPAGCTSPRRAPIGSRAPARRVPVAGRGADRVAAPAQPVRGRLICVGVLSRHKGQDVLVEALADLADRDWHCGLAGSLDRDPDFVEQLQTRITRLGYDHRVQLSGVLTGAALSHAYTTADLLVAPSRAETYGMTVTEALAHGLPVI